MLETLSACSNWFAHHAYTDERSYIRLRWDVGCGSTTKHKAEGTNYFFQVVMNC